MSTRVHPERRRDDDTAGITFRIKGPDRVNVDLFDTSHDVTRHLLVGHPMRDHEVEHFVWDGLADGDEPAPEGVYTLRIKEIDPRPHDHAPRRRDPPGQPVPTGGEPVSTALEVIGAVAGNSGRLAGPAQRRSPAAGCGDARGAHPGRGPRPGPGLDDQLAHVRHQPLELAAIVIALAGGLAALAASFIRWPLLLPLLLIVVLPFRIPIDTGSETSYLLIPLYLVIGGGVLAEAAALFRGGTREIGAPSGFARWLAIALAASIVLYAVQAAYSSDVSRAVQNIAFFLIPFTVLFGLLREVEWDSRLLRYGLIVVAGEALILALTGIVQHETRHIFWNEKAMESNEFDLEFRVNSLFWDPNIYARYLALSIVLMTGALIWVKDMRRFAAGALAIAVVFAGMALAFSQTSYFALLAGMVVLCALRWSVKWTAIAAAIAVAVATIVIVADRSTVEVHRGKSSNSLDETTSGRTRLASGGIDLAQARPAQGYGSGSFAVEFAKRNELTSDEAAVSHTEPITVAAEQGVIGIAAYIGVLVAAGFVLLGGVLAWNRPAVPDQAARIAIAAAFAALLAHTIGYAGFLTDPLTWALLAVGSALATLGRERIPTAPGDDGRRLHGFQRPLEALRGRAAAALHAAPHDQRVRRRRGLAPRGDRGRDRLPPRPDRGPAALLLQVRRGAGRGGQDRVRGAARGLGTRRGRWRCRSPIRSRRRCSTAPSPASHGSRSPASASSSSTS